GWGLPLPAFLAIVSVILLLLGGVLVLLGAMGRLAAFWLVFPLGFDMVTRGLDWANGVGLVTAVCLMLLGTGPLSRWKPEERFLLRRAGEAQPAFDRSDNTEHLPITTEESKVLSK
ncbi:MAG: hypothetical protein WAS33_27365, partial [Candidatus Promineifilaceae bacterium]